jgi:hypothetical protein
MYPGFFLAHNEKNSHEWERALEIIHLPDISFHLFFLSICTIHIHSHRDAWWEHCEWEIKKQVKSRK